MMDVDAAILALRADPVTAGLMRDSYLDADVRAAAERFYASAEFGEVWRLLASVAQGGLVVDLGSGTGVASYALARAGAREVVAVEPDPSAVVGRGAAAIACAGQPVRQLDSLGDALPLKDTSADAVYLRQVLHHVPDLPAVMAECCRVLRPGGLLLATREHIAENPRQLEAFRAAHPVHRLAGGESAWPRQAYLDAVTGAGLRLLGVWGQWDSILNAFPAARSVKELEGLPARKLENRLGRFGSWLARVPGPQAAVRAFMQLTLKPGHLLSFLAQKPNA